MAWDRPSERPMPSGVDNCYTCGARRELFPRYYTDGVKGPWKIDVCGVCYGLLDWFRKQVDTKRK